jgi:hypothetical protein
MSITLKSLIFIIILGLIAFSIANRIRENSLLSTQEFNLVRKLWFSFQILAFLSPSIWIFYGAVFFSSLFLIPKSIQSRALAYCFLLSTLPLLAIIVPGFGITNYFFQLNFARALSLFILLPAFISLMQSPNRAMRLFSQPADKFAISFIILISLLSFRDDTFSNGVRFCFLNFLDYFLPYFVISRAITNLTDLNKVLFVLFLSISISTLIGIFEAVKFWHIYNHLVQHLLDIDRLHSLDVRGGVLRAAATFMTPIALGYAITIGVGIYLYLSPLFNKTILKQFIILGYVIGLYVTVSRGPWVGFVFLCLVYIWTGQNKFKHYSKILAGTAISIPILLSTSFGQKLYSLLPFVGTIRADTVEYRERLMEMSSIVIQRNPFLGSTTFLDTPEMQSMMQGEGIIDIVNNYLQITLGYGFFGLFLFISIFLSLLWHINKLIKRLPKENVDLIRMGRALFATLAGIALIIYTVSSVDYIPYYYWIIFALSTSYIYIANPFIKSDNKP